MTLPTFSHSQISTWRECQQRWEYRYGQKLVRRRTERPLFIGNWVHRCLETHYGLGNWLIGHDEFSKSYDKLFDEEKERLDRGKSKAKEGPFEPLPSQVKRIMESYLWYYRNERIRVIGAEVPFELTVTGEDGLAYVLKGIIDLIYEDEDDLIWIRDHKVWTEIPDERAFHTMDPQLTIYLHGAKEALGVEAAGIEYNYVVSSPPAVPTFNQDGSISKRAITTDYPTLYKFLVSNGRDAREYRDILAPLAGASPFLRRYRMPRNELVTDRILADTERSAREIMGHATPVRNITRQCSWCSYEALCRAELYGLDTAYIRKHDFEVEDRRKVPVTS